MQSEVISPLSLKIKFAGLTSRVIDLTHKINLEDILMCFVRYQSGNFTFENLSNC